MKWTCGWCSSSKTIDASPRCWACGARRGARMPYGVWVDRLRALIVWCGLGDTEPMHQKEKPRVEETP